MSDYDTGYESSSSYDYSSYDYSSYDYSSWDTGYDAAYDTSWHDSYTYDTGWDSQGWHDEYSYWGDTEWDFWNASVEASVAGDSYLAYELNQLSIEAGSISNDAWSNWMNDVPYGDDSTW